MDERFIMHRYYSTGIATLIAAVVGAAFVLYDYFVNKNILWELIIVLLTLAIVKVLAMIYFRYTH